MKTSQLPAINLNNKMSLFAVCEFRDKHWDLLTITRFTKALSLCNEPSRLVFPTAINPNSCVAKKTSTTICSDATN